MAGTFEEFGIRCDRPPGVDTFHFESPINLTSGNVFSGECSVGAFTYVNADGSFTRTSIGRYCAIANQVCCGPGQHFTHALSTHPFIYDPEDGSAALGRFPAYRRILGTRPITLTDPLPDWYTKAKVVVGHDVWIGFRAVINLGVKIGHGAVIAANAVVTKDVDPYTIVGGVPARPIRRRFDTVTIDRLLELQWWDYDMAQVTASVDYGKVDEVIEYMRPLIAAAALPRFSPPRYELTRTGQSLNIRAAP
jgi:acetyltransferase-like isoleucine patch superfamily enzyme